MQQSKVRNQVEDYQVLQKVVLFEGIGAQGIEDMLGCLGARVRNYAMGAYALRIGEPVHKLGIVTKGALNIISEDEDGVRTIVAKVSPGEFFAEALCCAEVMHSPVSAQAAEETKVLWLDFRRIMSVCPKSCTHHMILIQRMVRVIAQKNMTLQSRIALLSAKTIRERVVHYLKLQMREQGQEILLPFNREELADYLCVDRSALSRELSRLRGEGLIDYDKNRFWWKG